MLNTSWSILIVDDEPDVLQMSEMVMKDFGDWHFMPPEVAQTFLHSTWTTAATRWKQMG